ncbi:hypothetical protein FRC01_014448 [Tulasnella sp. 417]|nr:hypothetical protein FRC01_014448 [Tulasnella sp. 417]
MAVVSTARNKELEAQLARLYGTPKERVERAEREQEEITYKKMLENEFEYAVAYQKLLEDDNERLRTVVHSLEAQLGLGVGTVSVKQEDEKPKLQSKELFIKDEEYD